MGSMFFELFEEESVLSKLLIEDCRDFGTDIFISDLVLYWWADEVNVWFDCNDVIELFVIEIVDKVKLEFVGEYL